MNETTSSTLMLHLKDVKEEPSRLRKKEMLDSLRSRWPGLSLRVMKAVFDPRITYGVAKKIPAPADGQGADQEFDGVTWTLLDDLAARRVTGNNAQRDIAAELGRLSRLSQELLICILQQNLRAGFGADVVNEVWGEGTIPEFKVMLAHPFKKYGEKATFPGHCDFKYDGVRAITFSDMQGFFSRSGKPLEAHQDLKDQVTKFFAYVQEQCDTEDALVIDCELVSLQGQFADTMSQVRASKRGADSGKVGIRVIDLFTMKEFVAGVTEEDQETRRELMEGLVNRWDAWATEDVKGWILPTETREVGCFEDVLAVTEVAWAHGLEGVIYKPWNGLWEAKRSKNWLKVKREGTIEAVIVEVLEGAQFSKFEGNCGAVRCRLPSGVLVNVAGMTDAMRSELWQKRGEIAGTVCEVEYHELTPDGSLRHPRMGIIRDDKKEVNPDGN